jgi:hypothetical protein
MTMGKSTVASLFVGVGLVALATLGAFWMKRQDAEVRRLRTDLAGVEARLDALKTESEGAFELARATRLAQRTRGEDDMLAQAEEAGERTQESPPEADKGVPERLTREESAVRAERLLSTYDEAVAGGADDPGWSVDTLRAAEAQVRTVIPGARILEARCGGGTCKIVVEHARGDNDPPGAHDLQDLPPFNAGCTLAHTPATATEPARSRLYLHKPGSAG